MSRKGTKQRKYSNEFLEKIICENQKEGKSAKYLSEKYGIPKGTIDTWGHKYRKRGKIIRHKKGRKKQSEEVNYKEKYEILKKFIESLEEVEQEKK